MKTVDIMETFVSAVEETVFKNWRHEGFIGEWNSEHANFEVDGKEYALLLREVREDEHWSEVTGRNIQ